MPALCRGGPDVNHLSAGSYTGVSHLEEELGLEEDVEEPQEEQGGEAGEEGAAEVEVLAVGGEEGSAGEAGEDGGCEEEGGGHDAGVHHDGHGQERAHAQASQEGEAEQHGHPHAAVLAVVRGHEEAEGEAGREEGEHDAAALRNGG